MTINEAKKLKPGDRVHVIHEQSIRVCQVVQNDLNNLSFQELNEDGKNHAAITGIVRLK